MLNLFKTINYIKFDNNKLYDIVNYNDEMLIKMLINNNIIKFDKIYMNNNILSHAIIYSKFRVANYLITEFKMKINKNIISKLYKNYYNIIVFLDKYNFPFTEKMFETILLTDDGKSILYFVNNLKIQFKIKHIFYLLENEELFLLFFNKIKAGSNHKNNNYIITNIITNIIKQYVATNSINNIIINLLNQNSSSSSSSSSSSKTNTNTYVEASHDQILTLAINNYYIEIVKYLYEKNNIKLKINYDEFSNIFILSENFNKWNNQLELLEFIETNDNINYNKYLDGLSHDTKTSIIDDVCNNLGYYYIYDKTKNKTSCNIQKLIDYYCNKLTYVLTKLELIELIKNIGYNINLFIYVFELYIKLDADLEHLIRYVFEVNIIISIEHLKYLETKNINLKNYITIKFINKLISNMFNTNDDLINYCMKIVDYKQTTYNYTLNYIKLYFLNSNKNMLTEWINKAESISVITKNIDKVVYNKIYNILENYNNNKLTNKFNNLCLVPIDNYMPDDSENINIYIADFVNNDDENEYGDEEIDEDINVMNVND